MKSKELCTILEGSAPAEVTKDSTLEIQINNEKIPVALYQTAVNKRAIAASEKNPAWEFLEEPQGICLHWFGNLPNWEEKFTPQKTAKQYVDNGFGSSTSATFLIGDSKFSRDSTNINEKVSIVQTEKTNSSNKFVCSGHCRTIEDPTFFVDVLHVLGKKYFPDNPYSYSILQRMCTGKIKPIPNQLLLSIEMLGVNFNKQESFPNNTEISNTLTVVSALVKKYKIPPAFNLNGHNELDSRKGDPGNKMIFIMKTLLGLKALKDKDIELAEICFNPFKTSNSPDITASSVTKYFEFCYDFYTRSDLKERVEETLKDFSIKKGITPIFHPKSHVPHRYY